MSQNNELSRVKNIIRSLSERSVSRGCTEAEALEAAQKVGTLLEQYNLSLAQVFMTEGEEVYEEYAFDTGRKNDDEFQSLVRAIGDFCDCKYWFSYPHRRKAPRGYRSLGKATKGNLNYKFFGLSSDIEMVKYLMPMLRDAMDTATAEFKKTDAWKNPENRYEYVSDRAARLDASRSFRDGFCTRILFRLRELKKEANARVKADWEERKAQFSDAERAVYEAKLPMALDQSPIEIKEDRREKKMTELGYRFKNMARSSRGANNDGAYSAGTAAGSRVNLGRPVGGGSAPLALGSS